jgi:hypothetical protein
MSKPFLHTVWAHTVSCGSVGTVYRGPNARDAQRAVVRWRKFAAGTEGRAAGQVVEHFIDGVLQPEGEYSRTDASRARMSAKASARGATGFRRPKVVYVVISGGKVRHEGTTRREAERAFTMWHNFARSREGSPQPTTIELTADGKIIKAEDIR